MVPYQDKETLIAAMKKYKTLKTIATSFQTNEDTIKKWAYHFGVQNLIGSQGARRHKINDSFFDVIDTEHKAYWLGFLMADGCIYTGSGKASYRLQVNLNDIDKCHLEKLNEDLSSDYTVITKNVKNKRTLKTYTCCQLKINCTKLCKSLMKFGVVPRKSIICKMPILRNGLISHYLRGYFDGDGCITGNKKQHIAIVGGNDMLTYFQGFLSKHEIVASIYDISHSRAQELNISSKESIKKFKYLIYKDATIYLDRKFKKFNCPA